MSNQTTRAMINIFAAPNQVFDAIREKTLSPWPAFFLLTIATSLVFGWYFMTVDLYQYMEASMLAAGQVIDSNELGVMVENESLIRYVSVATIALVGLVSYLVLALFYFLAAMLVAEGKPKYGQFFTLMAWGSMPSLLSLLSSAISYSMAEGFIYLAFLDKTTLAGLLGLGLESANFDITSSLSIAVIWSYVLFALGFARITGACTTAMVVVGVIPPIIQFGLTYLF